MAELIELGKAWFLRLGEQYGINPLIFGSIYIGTIPFFTVSAAWFVRNYRKKQSVLLPGLCAVFFFTSAYLYLMVEGENIPLWIYSAMIIMVVYGIWYSWKKIHIRLDS